MTHHIRHNVVMLAALAAAAASAALLVFPHATEAAIQFGDVTSLDFNCALEENCNTTTDVTAPLAAPAISGPNTVLLIGVSVNGNTRPLPDSVTYNGVTLGAPIDSGDVDFTRTAVWVVTNPVSGANVVVDYPDLGESEVNGVVMAAYYRGVNQTTSNRTPTTGTGGDSPASLSVTNSKTDDRIVGFFSVNDTTAAAGLTSANMGAGQTFRNQTVNSTEESQIGLSDEPGAPGSVTHSWAHSDGQGWAGVALPLVPAPGSLQKPPNNLGLVGYWSFNEGTGTVAGDFSGNGKHGTLTNSPSWVSGKRGTALSFPGSTDFVDLGDNFDFSGSFTICAWARPTDIANQGYVAGKFDADTQNGWFVRQVGTDWRMGGDGNTLLSATLVEVNAWQHLCFVGVPSPGTSIAYVNGVSVATTDQLPAHVDNAHSATIADRYDNARNFQGSIDEVRFYTRVLGPTEIAKLYQSGAARAGASSADLDAGSSLESGLVGHWTMDGKDTQSTITDLSGNGNHGYYLARATSSAKVIGKLGQALDFNGDEDEFVLIPASSAVLDLQTALTVSAWVKTRTEVDDDGIFIRGSVDERWYFYLDDGALTLGSKNDGDFTFAVENSPTSHVGQWVHLVGVMDSTLSPGSASIKLYRNGVELTDKTFQWTNGFDSDNAFTDIGASFNDSSGSTADGAIDDLRIYNRALTADEARQLYNLGRATITQ